MEPNPELEQAVKDAIAAKRANPDYMARLDRHVEENRPALDKLRDQ